MIEGEDEGEGSSCSSRVSRSARGSPRRSRSSTSRPGGRNKLLTLDDGSRVFAELYGPPRASSSTAPSTRPRRCAAARSARLARDRRRRRAKFATPERIPSADELIVEWPQEAFAQVQPDHQTAIVVLTHDDKFDEPALIGALETEAFYIGALGSRRNQERRRERLLEAGVKEAALDRIMGPCGLDIGADTQEETALSILARDPRGAGRREGGFLRTRRSASTSRWNNVSATRGRVALYWDRAREGTPARTASARPCSSRPGLRATAPSISSTRTAGSTNAKRAGLRLRATAETKKPGASRMKLPDGSVVDGEVELGEQVETDFYGRPVHGRVVNGPWADALSALAGLPLTLVRADEPGAGLDRGAGGGRVARLDGCPSTPSRRLQVSIVASTDDASA